MSTLDRRINDLAALEARLSAARRATCASDQHNLRLVRSERERLELQREAKATPRDTATLPLFGVGL